MSLCLSTRTTFAVLLVEAGSVDAELLGELLDEADADEAELLHACSLGEAIAVLVERDVDLVLVNLHLPDSDGLETFIRLQAIAPGVPIIPHNGLTRARLEERPARGLEAGDGRRPWRPVADLGRCLQRAVRRRAIERSLLHLATHDQLTGLANRVLLEDRLRQAIARSRRSGRPGALLFVDLDEFKPINDRYGHGIGDRVLCTIARRLRRAVRETDTVARFGGDEFIVLIESLASREAIMDLVDKLAAVIAEPIHQDGLMITVSASIGVALFPAHGEDTATLVRHADHAMYDAKRARHGLYHLAAETRALGPVPI